MRPLDGYPTSWGSQRSCVFPHTGPDSYTKVTIAEGDPITPGDTVLATEAGMKYFDHVADGVTDDGVFRVVAIPNNPSSNGNGPPSGGFPSCTLMWFANKTATYGGQAQVINTEVAAATDLSTFIVRLLAIGPK